MKHSSLKQLSQKQSTNRLSNKSKGQVVVEYVLLLIASVTIATVITKLMVSRDPENAGFLVDKWNQIQKVIGDDLNN